MKRLAAVAATVVVAASAPQARAQPWGRCSADSSSGMVQVAQAAPPPGKPGSGSTSASGPGPGSSAASASASASASGSSAGSASPAARAERLEIDDCGPKPAISVDRMRALAGEHYDRGDVLYVQGDYTGAVSEFIASYCLIPYFSVLKDIGQAYERQLEYSRAIAYLQRYVDDIPADAKGKACGPAPQEDKRNVSARIAVLASLPARISVATDPPDAEITLTGDDGIVARGVSVGGSGQVVARAGDYLMTVRKAGFVPFTKRISAEIGKPYSFIVPLKPESGHLSVQVVPGNARLFLDDRFVGIGRYEADLPGATYTLLVESSDRISERRKIEVKAKQSERVVVQLAPKPESGRTQMLAYSAIAGAAVVGGSLASATSSVATIGAIGGLAIGGVAGYVAIPDDVSLGTSSATITGSLGGGAMGTLIALAIGGDDSEYVGPSLAIGTAIGGGAGFYAARTINLSAGDAALINTGMVWGGVYGGLFAAVFDNPETIDYSLTAGGVGLGLITSGLLLRSFSISRSHAALIDLGGVGGLVLSAGVRALIDQEDASAERQANFALAGATIGLAGAALLTRNYDDPSAPNVQPSLGRVSTIDGGSTTSIGVVGSF